MWHLLLLLLPCRKRRGRLRGRLRLGLRVLVVLVLWVLQRRWRRLLGPRRVVVVLVVVRLLVVLLRVLLAGHGRHRRKHGLQLVQPGSRCSAVGGAAVGAVVHLGLLGRSLAREHPQYSSWCDRVASWVRRMALRQRARWRGTLGQRRASDALHSGLQRLHRAPQLLLLPGLQRQLLRLAQPCGGGAL